MITVGGGVITEGEGTFQVVRKYTLCGVGSLRFGGEKNTYDNHLLVIGDAAGKRVWPSGVCMTTPTTRYD